MPTDPTLNAPAATAAPAIENEIPTYRAISTGAVFSLLFGVLAVFSYANLGFLVFSVLAVITGVLSDRKIQRLSDILTGRTLAQAGIGLGLVFGLTSVTISLVQGFLLENAARRFGADFEQVLTKGSLNDAIWYGQPPDVRKGKSSDDLVREMEKTAPDRRMMEMQYQGVRTLKEKLMQGAEVHFEGIEAKGDTGNDLYAAALYELHKGKAERFDPAKDTWALALLKGRKKGRTYEWFVQEIKYPYERGTHVEPEKAVDDGHGHAH